MSENFDFVQTNGTQIYNTVMNSLMDFVDEPLYPGDERRIYAEALVFVLINVYNELNDTAKQRTLQFARGKVLDALGERTGTKRLQPSPAYDVFRFSLEKSLDFNVIIPKGTRITPDGKIYFATQENAVIRIGETSVDVVAICTTFGADFNGLAVGTVKTLVDLIPYVSSVSNLNGTSGGDDGEPYTPEGDNRYRERIRISPATFSTAGTLAAYKYHALSADPNIIDVLVYSPKASEIVILPLMKGGKIPDDETIQKIQDVFTSDIRPLTDMVIVKAPEEVTYDIHLTYYCTAVNEADAIQVVELGDGAIAQYNKWQSGGLGRNINPDQLKKFILAPKNGMEVVDRVDITAPVFTDLPNEKVAKFSGNLIVNHIVNGSDSV